MKELTEAQLRALRWMRDYPSTSAGWCDSRGKRPKGGPDNWTTMKLEGALGSILIPLADWRALRGLFDGCPSGDKIYGPNEQGLSVLRERAA